MNLPSGTSTKGQDASRQPMETHETTLAAQIAACKIATKNHISYARVLTDSFLKYPPESTVFVLRVDSLKKKK